eukprot:7334325-Prymnesium_polylepis.1
MPQGRPDLAPAQIGAQLAARQAQAARLWRVALGGALPSARRHLLLRRRQDARGVGRQRLGAWPARAAALGGRRGHGVQGAAEDAALCAHLAPLLPQLAQAAALPVDAALAAQEPAARPHGRADPRVPHARRRRSPRGARPPSTRARAHRRSAAAGDVREMRVNTHRRLRPSAGHIRARAAAHGPRPNPQPSS